MHVCMYIILVYYTSDVTNYNTSLRFALLNEQSINNKSVAISSFIKDCTIDIFALTETWHDRSTDFSLRRAAPDGYRIIDAPRAGCDDGTVNHGGINLFHRDTFTSRIITLPLQLMSFELLVCHLRSTTSKLIFVTVYRRSSACYRGVF